MVKFILEFDGVAADPAGAWYRAHHVAAGEVGWSRLAAAEFWRLTRTKGGGASVLPGAKPAKVKAYQDRFAELLEVDETIELMQWRDGMQETLRQFGRFGTCLSVTLGSNVKARERILTRQPSAGALGELVGLDADPRRRPGQIATLAGGAGAKGRVLVVAATDALIRAAGQAGLVTAGVATGSCSIPRLRLAGADVVYRECSELVAALRSGAAELLRAGLLPLGSG